MQKRIVWEDYTYEYLENQNIFRKEKELEGEEEKPSFKDGYSDDEELNDKLSRIVQTPFGIYQLDDDMNPFKQYKFWMAHTNFTISYETAGIIKSLPGVEGFHPLSRYRFLVAFGQLFESSAVKTEIQNALCKNLNTNESLIEEKILELKEQLKVYPKWTIYLFPNGRYDIAFLEKDKSNLIEYEQKVNLFRDAEKMSHGKLISNEQ